MAISKLEASCIYLSMLYDMSYKQDGNQLIIYGKQSRFKVNLTDMKRFGVYELYHKNNHRIGDKTTWHRQLKSKDIYKVIFYAFSHDFHKDNDLWSNQYDVSRFKKDVELFVKDNGVRNRYLYGGGFTICPFCKRKLSVLNKDGEIRYTIHCRCYFNNRHTALEWKSGVGYVLKWKDKEMLR